MIGHLLDTNVLSEIRKARRGGSPAVRAWWEGMRSQPVYLSVLVLGEIRKGIVLLRRKDPAAAVSFEAWLEETKNAFQSRILDLDVGTTQIWGDLQAIRPLPAIDGLLAATALRHDLTLVTRNIDDFAGLGLRLFNPFGTTPTAS